MIDFQFLLFVLLFYIPAGIANMTPSLLAKIPVLQRYAYPLDFNITIKGKRVLGDHKSILGLFGIIAAILYNYVQYYLYEHVSFFHQIVPNTYQHLNPFIIGFLLGFGAIFGDALKSFWKRQVNIEPGQSWFPFDQLDYIVGSNMALQLYYPLPLKGVIASICLYFLLHLLFSFIGFLVHVKKSPI